MFDAHRDGPLIALLIVPSALILAAFNGVPHSIFWPLICLFTAGALIGLAIPLPDESSKNADPHARTSAGEAAGAAAAGVIGVMIVGTGERDCCTDR